MPDGSTLIKRPEHSPLGGSGAERWINCAGSYALIQAIGSGVSEAPDYQTEGKEAHAIAERMLKEGIAEAWEIAPSQETADAVQVYINYVRERSVGKRVLVEHRVSNAKLHPLAYGQLDAAIFDPEPGIALEIIDYKHGVGVIVDVVENVQERYYAACFISGDTWPSDLPRLDDTARIKLTIVQPRGFQADGQVIHSWVVSAAELRNWAWNTVGPAMEKAVTDGGKSFAMGEWCRFCPAKLACPAMRKLGADAALAQTEAESTLLTLDDEWLGQWYGRLSQLRMFIKAISDETDRRMKAGATIATAKLVYAKVDRAFKPSALQPVIDPDLGEELAPPPILTRFGDEAWTKPEIKSPAQIEKLPGGKEFCAEWAEKPKAGLVVAPLSDARKAQKWVSDEEMFKDVQMPT